MLCLILSVSTLDILKSDQTEPASVLRSTDLTCQDGFFIPSRTIQQISTVCTKDQGSNSGHVVALLASSLLCSCDSLGGDLVLDQTRYLRNVAVKAKGSGLRPN